MQNQVVDRIVATCIILNSYAPFHHSSRPTVAQMISSIETIPSSADSTLVTHCVRSVIADLRTLLAVPKAKQEHEWQGNVSALISALVADFSRQEDPAIAFVEIALVTLAAQRGSRDAKKRTLRPNRWNSTPPPSISALFDDLDEARSAVRVLQPLRADWLEEYIFQEVVKNKWPTLTGPLIDLILRATPSVEEFLSRLHGVIRKFGLGPQDWIVNALESTTKILAKARLPAGIGMMAEVAALLEGLDSHAALDKIPESTRQKTRDAFVGLISQVASIEPALLVQGGVVAAILRLYPALGGKGNPAPRELEVLCRRTISLLSVLLPNADQIQLSHYREIWGLYRKTLSKADQLLKVSSRQAPQLNALEAPRDEQSTNNAFGVTARLESILCELIVNWDDYYTIHSSDPAAGQLSARIDELIRQLGVSRFGEIGEQTGFNPLQHHLQFRSTMPPSKVVVTKPGIALERSDGTFRVLLMAAVSPIDSP